MTDHYVTDQEIVSEIVSASSQQKGACKKNHHRIPSILSVQVLHMLKIKVAIVDGSEQVRTPWHTL